MDFWKEMARLEVARGAADPDYVPVYQVPARRWWQFWKPKWQTISGVSRNQICRAHGLPHIGE